MKFLLRLVPHHALALLLLLALASPLCAADYFVATNGNDNNNGLTAARPFRNVARAALLATAPGDTVTVAAGTYTETVSLLRSGSPTAPITFTSPTRGAAKIVGQVRILGSNITLSGFDITNRNGSGVIISSDRVRILKNDIHDCSGHGISAFSFDYLTIEGNRLFRNGQQNFSQASGISLYQPIALDQAPGFHIIVRGNESFENDSVVSTQAGGTNFRVGIGIQLDDFRNTLEGSTAGVYRPATLIENNLVYGNVGRAIVISLSDNITVRHNTAYHNLPLRNTNNTLGDFSCQDTDSVRWVNNILVTRAASLNAIFDARNTNSTWDYNVIGGGSLSIAADSTTVLGSHNYLLDPRLIAPDTYNFRPGPGSIAIDNGSSAFAAPSDFEGTARPIASGFDIGAFETKPDLTAPSGIAPTLATQPISQTLLPGGIITLSVAPSGSPPLTYQWSRNGAAISGATAAAFTLSPLQSADAGVYDVKVTNPAGTITSNPATIAVAVTPTFTFRNPTPALGTLFSVGFGAGKFLAVGIGGRIVTSPDAVNWSLAATLPTAAAPTTALRGIAHNGSLWVAVGDSGVIFTSPDTVVWTPRTSPTTQTLLAATYANNQFLACGNSGTILVSPDGINWSLRPPLTPVVTQQLTSITGRLGAYVAVGQTGTILTSPDSIAWTRITLPGVTQSFYNVSLLTGQFIAVGDTGRIYSSADGIEWTSRTTSTITNNLRSVTHNGSQFIITTDGERIVVTADFATFISRTLSFNLNTARLGSTSANGLTVAVGQGGEIATTPDGLAWTQRGGNGTMVQLNGVTFLNTQWFAVGNSTGILTSPDAVTWMRLPIPAANGLNAIGYGAGRYVAIGDQGYITTSLDAATWVGNTTASGTTQSLRGIAYANGRWVVVGFGGVIRTSTNGTTWTTVASPVTTNFNALTTFGSTFIAIGDSGVIRTSTDGTTWTAATSGTTQALRGICVDRGTAYIVGSNRTILASTDAQTWTTRTAPAANNSTYRGITAANGGLFIVGEQGVALFSPDSVTWSYLPSLAYRETLYAVASNGLSTVIVASGGTILQAGNPTVLPSRLVNVATRGLVQPGGNLIPGFVLRGTGSKRVVVRAVGPTLSAFGLSGLSDLKLDVVNQQTQATAASNDDWGGSSPLSTAFASLGAFPLTASSKDAAVQTTLPVNQGGYSVKVAASGTGTTGVALAEVYDADSDDSPVRVINVSTLGFVGTGANVLTPGFVIRGTVPKIVLIRAIGPGLAQLGVGGLLADPQFSVFLADSDVAIATSNDWGGTAALKAAFTTAGAFNLAADNSKDAAIVLTLPPGGYTVVTSGVANTTGTALVEVYDLDP